MRKKKCTLPMRLAKFSSYLSDGFHEVLFDNVVSLGSDREHARFGTNITEIGPVEIVGQFHNCNRKSHHDPD